MTHVGAVWEELLPVGWTHVREVCGVLSLVGGTHWSRGRTSPWAVAGATCDEWTTWTDSNPHSLSSCTPGGEVEPKQGGGVEVFFKIYCMSRYPALILLVINQLISPSSMCFAHDCIQWMSSPNPSLMNLSLCFLSPLYLQRGVTEQLWWVPGVHPPQHHVCSPPADW